MVPSVFTVLYREHNILGQVSAPKRLHNLIIDKRKQEGEGVGELAMVQGGKCALDRSVIRPHYQRPLIYTF